LEEKKKCPVIAVLILIAAVWWLLQDLGVLATRVPWLPIIVILAVIGKMMHPTKK